MLVVPPTIAQVYQTNLTPSARTGTSIAANSTIHTKGSWTELIAETNKESYGIDIGFREPGLSATDTRMLVDIAFGDVGGGNEEIIIPNLNAGNAGGTNRPGMKKWHFPIYVPSGVSISARSQAVISSDNTNVFIWLTQDPLYPFVGGLVQDYGTDLSGSQGTSVTPGDAVWPTTWTELTTSSFLLQRDHRFWTIGVDGLGDTSFIGSNLPWLVQLGIGPDSGNVTVIAGIFHIGAVSAEEIPGPTPFLQHGVAVKGDQLWARMASGSTPEARGVIAYGID